MTTNVFRVSRFGLALHLFALVGAISYAVAITHLVQAINALSAAIPGY